MLSLLFDARLILPKPPALGNTSPLCCRNCGLKPGLAHSSAAQAVHLAGWGGQWRALASRSTLAMNDISAPALDAAPDWRTQIMGVDLVHYPHFDAPVLSAIPLVAAMQVPGRSRAFLPTWKPD
ncbi:MAG: hypothetical protein H6662_02815 [Ardenticatenaceae bacterium]|nr:hypothetical protein [Ardenticatenaceae bacterium]